MRLAISWLNMSYAVNDIDVTVELDKDISRIVSGFIESSYESRLSGDIWDWLLIMSNHLAYLHNVPPKSLYKLIVKRYRKALAELP